MRRLHTIGDTSGPGIVDGGDLIWVRDSKGRFYHSGYHIGSEIRLFDGDGKFLKLLGRHGAGPGEFKGRSPLFVGKGDTLHVFNSGTRTYNVFDPDLRLVRASPTPIIPGSIVESPDGNLIAAALLRTPEAVGYPLHRLTRNADYISSFGAVDPYVGIQTAFLSRRLAINPGGRSFFSLHRYRLTFEEWTWDGRLLRTFVAEPAWFAPVKPFSGPDLPLDGSSPLASMLVAGRLDSNGLLWLICNIPDRNWRDAFLVHGQPSVHGIEPSALHLWDSMILVIDLAQKEIVKRVRTDRWIGGFVGQDVFVTVEAGLGHPQVEIWSLQLVR